MRVSLLSFTVLCTFSLAACGTLSKIPGFSKKTETKTAATAAMATPTPATPTADEQTDMARAMGTSVKADLPDTPAPKTATSSDAPCPGVEILPETRSISYFDETANTPSDHLMGRAAITRIRGGCNYTGNTVEVDIDLLMRGKITLDGRRGKKESESFLSFPYFVAVSDARGQLLDKQILATAMTFPPAKDDVDHIESVRQRFDVGNPSNGQNYTITIGFQLTRDQLAFNARQTVKPNDQPIAAGKMKPIVE